MTDDDDIVQAPPNVLPRERRDTDYSPSSDRDVEELQEDQRDSPALEDPGIDRDEVTLLPGTGGVDDTGQEDVPPGEVHVPRRPEADAVGPIAEQAAEDGGR